MTSRAQPLFKVLARLYGVVFATLIVATQFVAVYPISEQYGPDASYEVFIAALGWSFIVLIVGTVIGVVIERSSRTTHVFRRRILLLWTVSALVVALAIPFAFGVARHSESGQWFLNYQKELSKSGQPSNSYKAPGCQ